MRKVLFILLILAIPVLLLAAEPVREWKNKYGKTIIEASLDNTKANDDPDQVYFLKGGQRFKYPFENLSKADQDYVTRIRKGRRSIDGGGQNGEIRSMQVVPQSRRFALLIGVNEYARPIKSLQFCVNDMKLLAESFVKIGVPRDNIFLVTDDSPAERRPTGENIRHQIETVTQLMGPNDQLTIAFSGHGAMVNGKSYLCPSDTNLDNKNSIISRDWAFAQLEKCKAKQKIFIIDACRDEVSFGDQRALGGTKTLEDPIGADTHGFILIASCDKKQKSWEHSKLKHGVFTYFLAEGLIGAAKDEDGYVSIMSIFQYASSKTKKYVYLEFNKAQVPTIGLRDEMTDFVIAKLDGGIIVPQKVEDVIIRKYTIGSIIIDLQPITTGPSGEKIQAGKIQLPPVPKKIRELTGEVQGIKDALTRMENGTHEALREAQQAKADAQAQYEAIKARRDEDWKQLSPTVRINLEQKIKKSPTAEPITFDELQPKNVGYSQFIKQVLWGQKTEQARLERVRVESALEVEIQKEINRIKAALADKTAELDLETRKFRQSLVQFLLEQTPGWNKPNEDEKMDYLFLSETIPALRKYPFGWDEKSLFKLAATLWKERRPCVKERIKEERERPERERQERIAREETARAETREQLLSIPGTKAGERRTVTVNGVEFAFRWCPPGTFMMGSPTSEEGRYKDETQHRVTLTQGFWMLETEVTQKQWQAVMRTNPSNFKGYDLPVENVSWEDCQEFCKKTGFQLPTEAQWEYACRAGTTGAYASSLDDMAWYNSNSNEETHSVGTKKYNAWGLYNMHGNVWEWCQDWYEDYPSGNVTDPTGPTNVANSGGCDCGHCDGNHGDGCTCAKCAGGYGDSCKYCGGFGCAKCGNGPGSPWEMDSYAKNMGQGNKLAMGAVKGTYDEETPDCDCDDGEGTAPTLRVGRGGSWVNDARDCRAACRNCSEPDRLSTSLGFRCIIKANNGFIQNQNPPLEKDYNVDEGILKQLFRPANSFLPLKKDFNEDKGDDPFAFLENFFRSQQHPRIASGARVLPLF